MSKKQWIVLLMLFLTYLLLGASIFYHIESNLEIEHVKKAKEERIEINALLHEHYVSSNRHDQREIFEKLTRYCGKSVYNYTEEEIDPLKWDFYNSFYFAYTVVSTIGYGNLAPTNMLSRILMIFYGLIGIPMNGILLTQLGEFFSHVFIRAHRKYKSYKRRQTDYYPKKLTSFETRKLGLAAQIFIYLIPGFVMFIFFPAFLFSHYEGWTYDEAVYYAFVTLTTIGFGDYVAGQDNSKGSGIFFILYKTFLICWISFGLGYIVMIMTFIAQGMRSKKITRIEHRLAMNIKNTQSKIWNEFNKEVNYLRRVFNELQLSKVKRIYVDECDYEVPPAKFPHSNSFPDLRDLMYSGLKNVVPQHPRRRANSEVVPTDEHVTRVVSETDLQRIDKTATFAAHAMVQPAELLARLVNILGYIPPPIPAEDANDSETELTEKERENINNEERNEEKRKKREKKKRKKAESEEEAWEEGMAEGAEDEEEETKDGEKVQKEEEEEEEEEEQRKSKERKFVERSGYKESPWTGSFWRIGSERIHPFGRPRSRAASEVRWQEAKNETSLHQRQNCEWTWSGPVASGKMQELIKAQRVDVSARTKDGRSYKFPSFTLPKSMPGRTILPKLKRQFNGKKSVDPLEPVSSSGIYGAPVEEDALSNGKFDNDNLLRGADSRRLDDGNDSIVGRHYFTHTGADLSSVLEGNNLLEETSLADFLRALTIVRTRVGNVPDEYVSKPRRKMGTASLTPPKLPSLFTLFSPASAPASAIHSEENTVTSAQQSQTSVRRSSLKMRENSSSYVVKGTSSAKSRRFSLRPVPTSSYAASTTSTDFDTLTPKNPDYHPSSVRPPENTFIVESAKQSLVKMESTPGISTPMTSASDLRRFSLRSRVAEKVPNVTNVSKLTSSTTHAFKVYPRWKAGMLQRQIGQKSIRRRVRAFSLSDVGTDQLTERNITLNRLATDHRTVTTARTTMTTMTNTTFSATTTATITTTTAAAATATATEYQDTSKLNIKANVTSSQKMVKIVPKREILSECETQTDVKERILASSYTCPQRAISARTSCDENRTDNLTSTSTESTSGNDDDYKKRFLVNPGKGKPQLSTDTYKDNLLQIKVQKPVRKQADTKLDFSENAILPDIKIEKLEKNL